MESVRDEQKQSPESTLFGRKCVVTVEVPQGAIYIHPQTLLDMFGVRTDGTVVGDWMILKG